jgi:hypothetical protein
MHRLQPGQQTRTAGWGTIERQSSATNKSLHCCCQRCSKKRIWYTAQRAARHARKQRRAQQPGRKFAARLRESIPRLEIVRSGVYDAQPSLWQQSRTSAAALDGGFRKMQWHSHDPLVAVSSCDAIRSSLMQCAQKRASGHGSSVDDDKIGQKAILLNTHTTIARARAITRKRQGHVHSSETSDPAPNTQHACNSSREKYT